jgi:threonine aldolase
MTEYFTIDLRSDTVTQPTPSMRKAMAEAIVGDDVYGEDPTVNRLERVAAELLGKESAMFVPSGTMGNLICILTHCGRGEEVIIGDQAHLFLYERGGSAVLGGIHPYTVSTATDGSLPLSAIRKAVRPDDIHCPRTKLLCLENTQAQRGGVPLSLTYLQSLRDLANELGLALHCDGARLWNASVATGVEPSVLSSPFDSLSVCLSKGLGAPIGSLVIGRQSFIDEARRLRKLLGGGMRQVGAIAAAGLIAIQEMRERLATDHENAQFLAAGLRECGYEITHPVRTNIIFFRQHEEDTLSVRERLAVWKNSGLLVSDFGDCTIRAVTHYGIERKDIDHVISIVQKV